MAWGELDRVAQILGGGWRMARGLPPADAVWVVRRAALEDGGAVCGGEPKPVVYLAAKAEGQWFALGKVAPAERCVSVTFYREFPSARRAVEALVDYGKRIFDFFTPQFDVSVVEAVGLCGRPDFADYCERRRAERPLRRATAGPAAPPPQEGPASGSAPRRVGLDAALRCLFGMLGLEAGGCGRAAEVDFEAVRCWAAGLLGGRLEEWERCVLGGRAGTRA